MSWIGAQSSTWLYGPTRSIVRTARGPKRVPGRFDAARSNGTPVIATSSPEKSGAAGSTAR